MKRCLLWRFALAKLRFDLGQVCLIIWIFLFISFGFLPGRFPITARTHFDYHLCLLFTEIFKSSWGDCLTWRSQMVFCLFHLDFYLVGFRLQLGHTLAIICVYCLLRSSTQVEVTAWLEDLKWSFCSLQVVYLHIMYLWYLFWYRLLLWLSVARKLNLLSVQKTQRIHRKMTSFRAIAYRWPPTIELTMRSSLCRKCFSTSKTDNEVLLINSFGDNIFFLKRVTSQKNNTSLSKIFYSNCCAVVYYAHFRTGFSGGFPPSMIRKCNIVQPKLQLRSQGINGYFRTNRFMVWKLWTLF